MIEWEQLFLLLWRLTLFQGFWGWGSKSGFLLVVEASVWVNFSSGEDYRHFGWAWKQKKQFMDLDSYPLSLWNPSRARVQNWGWSPSSLLHKPWLLMACIWFKWRDAEFLLRACWWILTACLFHVFLLLAANLWCLKTKTTQFISPILIP